MHPAIGRSVGVTLFELLVALAILSLLLLGAAPSFTTMVEKTRQHSEAYQLHRAIRLTRSEAVMRSTTVTVCGSLDGATCAGDWQEATLLIFVDLNSNGRLDAQEELLRAEPFGGRWLWRGSLGRPYMRIRPSGHPMEWGTFHRCVSNGDIGFRQLVINRVGRSYSRDNATPHPDC